MPLGTNNHVDSDLIEQYSMGNLSEEEAAPVEEHLLVCSYCRNLLQEADEYTPAMRTACAALRQEEGSSRSRWAFPSFLPAVAGTLAVLVAAVGLDLAHQKQAPTDVALESMRGSGIEATAPAGRPVSLHFDLTGLPSLPGFRAEVVASSGKPVWAGPVTPKGTLLPRLSAGSYLVQISTPSGELLREYALSVR
jgi:hypothetical protein